MTPKQEAALRQAREALANSLDSVANAYYNDWRHGIPTRKAQLDGLKQDLEKHESALAAIDEALAEQPHCDDCGGFDPECPLAQPRKPWVGLTDEEMHDAIGTAGVDLLELAKLWSDNKIHVYQFDNEARKIIKDVLFRAHGIKGDA